MTTLTSFLANRSEGSSIEGLCKFRLCEHIDWRSCEKKKKKGFELVQDNVCIISIADDRDDSHAVALSIQYSWKCDTFPFQKDGTQSKTFFFFFFLSTSTGCSFQSIIEFPKKSIWLRGHGHAARCLRQDDSKYAERSGLRGMPVLLSLMPLCSVLLADS